MEKSSNVEKTLKNLNNQEIEFKVATQPEISKGVYSNIAIIRHTENEFIFDFIFKLGNENIHVSRIILSPKHALAFKEALEKNLKMYKEKNKEKQRKTKK